jgi:short subunit dehydrogenase-like uncharacterized protein
MSDRNLDLVLFGATGFVGRLTAEHLAATAPPDLRVALAGRSAERLAAVRADLGPAAADWSLEVADAADPEAMAGLAARTQVVATTVGPYLRYGTLLAEACAREGTAYADLTGEILFVRRTADRLGDLAASTGARLVHACGFDSVPSDLGVLLLHEAARADDAGELTDTVLLVRSMKGGFSGGTIDSMRVMTEELRRDAEARRILRDPHALSPDRAAEIDAPADQMAPRRDPQLGVWTAPFVMATFNTRIVRRSNALLGHAYGRGFRYREVMGVGRGPTAPLVAAGVTAGLGAGLAGMALPPTRMLLDRVLPAPGEGPSEEARRNGRFRMELTADTTSGRRYRAVVAAQGDPGYQATSVMLGQAALALALDGDALPDMAGVLTPATGIGRPLVERLRAQGFTLEVEAV